jgi:hypothetical protein
MAVRATTPRDIITMGSGVNSLSLQPEGLVGFEIEMGTAVGGICGTTS